jgi:hypothetical protein
MYTFTRKKKSVEEGEVPALGSSQGLFPVTLLKMCLSSMHMETVATVFCVCLAGTHLSEDCTSVDQIHGCVTHSGSSARAAGKRNRRQERWCTEDNNKVKKVPLRPRER